jgi:predicted amidohydrolase
MARRLRVFKLALIQMRVEGGRKDANLVRARKMIAAAAEGGARMALLPEALDLGWTHPSAKTEAEAIPGGGPCRALREVAREKRIYVCAGLTERAGAAVFNAAVIISPDEEVILHHRKLNELDIGHKFYAQGDRLGVCYTELGTLGLMICADGFAKGEVISRSLCYMGADIILSPSAWAVTADHDNVNEPYGALWRRVYKPVAKGFSVYIASASNVGPITGGPWQGRKCIGCSLVIGPDGEEIMQGPYGEGAEVILYADICPVERPARGGDWAAVLKER